MTMKINEYLYSPELLPVTTSGDEGLLMKHMVETLEKSCPMLKFDCFCVNLFTVRKGSMSLDGRLKGVVYNIAKSVIPSYERNISSDPFTGNYPMRNLGIIFITDDIQEHDAWMETKIFKTHCISYDIHHVLAVAFRVPNWKNRFLVFHFMNSLGNRFELDKRDLRIIEFSCIPFWLRWLCMHKQMCRETLNERLVLLERISRGELSVLKNLIKYPGCTSKQLAKKCYIEESTLASHLKNIREKVLGYRSGKNVTALYRKFDFLSNCV